MQSCARAILYVQIGEAASEGSARRGRERRARRGWDVGAAGQGRRPMREIRKDCQHCIGLVLLLLWHVHI
eukprot:5302820-Pleurochrysis_carterae.AAC.3